MADETISQATNKINRLESVEPHSRIAAKSLRGQNDDGRNDAKNRNVAQNGCRARRRCSQMDLHGGGRRQLRLAPGCGCSAMGAERSIG